MALPVIEIVCFLLSQNLSKLLEAKIIFSKAPK